MNDEAAVRLVKDGYNAVADQYLELAANVTESHPRRDRVEALLLRLPEAADVLEIGCGAGLPVARCIADAGHRYTGVDISDRQIELARQHVPEGVFVVEDVTNLSFPSSRFDAIVMLYAITHIPVRRWPELIGLMHDWLRPAGLLLVNAPDHASPGWLEENFLGFGVDNWTNALDRSETHAALTSGGFDILDETQLPDDEPGPGWVWILARTRR